mgnify:FL=1
MSHVTRSYDFASQATGSAIKTLPLPQGRDNNARIYYWDHNSGNATEDIYDTIVQIIGMYLIIIF